MDAIVGREMLRGALDALRGCRASPTTQSELLHLVRDILLRELPRSPAARQVYPVPLAA